MTKEKLTERIEIRVTRQEKNVIKMLADVYAEGNISAYIVDRVINSNRKFIKEKDFNLSVRRFNKGRTRRPMYDKEKDLS